MRSHELSCLSERDGQSVFSTKGKKQQKKKKRNQNQNHKYVKECHEHYTFSMIQNLFALHASASQTSCSYQAISFLFIYQIPKSNFLSFEFRMRGPLKESTPCFLIRLSPSVLVHIGLFHKTESPRLYLSQDSKYSPLTFIGLKVLAFMLSQDSKSSLLSLIGLKVL